MVTALENGVRLRALYLCDGTSDRPIGRHLETLCAQVGVSVEVVPFPSSLIAAGSVEVRLRRVLAEDPEFEIIFVHRDAEDPDPAPRFLEIQGAAIAVAFAGAVIGVVPVRMTEAWLLLDEHAIRTVAGKPRGTANLHLPAPGNVERLADPKTALQDALLTAAEVSGRRRKSTRQNFDYHRRTLSERLDLTGPITQLSAWQRLVDDVANGVGPLG